MLNSYNSISSKTMSIYRSLDVRLKVSISITLLFSLLVAIIEVLHLHIIGLFIESLTSKSMMQQKHASELFLYFGIISTTLLVSRSLFVYFQTRVPFKIINYLGLKIFRNSMRRSLDYFDRTQSAELISLLILHLKDVVHTLFIPVLNIFNSFVMILLIGGYLLYVNVILSIGLVLIIVSGYLALIAFNRKSLSSYSETIYDYTQELTNHIVQSWGSIKEIKINQTQSSEVDTYNEIDSVLRDRQSRVLYRGQIPRPIIEYLGLLALLGSVFILPHEGEFGFVQTLSVFAFGFLKILISAQQAFSSINNILGAEKNLNMIVDNMQTHAGLARGKLKEKSTLITTSPLSISRNKKCVQIENATKIDLNEWTVITGASGSGKTTFLEAVLGMRKVTSGEIKLGGTLIQNIDLDWYHSKFSYVPQSGYILDSTVLENITGKPTVSQVSQDLLKKALMITGISDEADSADLNLFKECGENGKNLSGGQRQLVQIARSIYYNRSILVLDESTSAMDDETQDLILKNLKDFGNYSVIMITHRKQILKYFNNRVDFPDV